MNSKFQSLENYFSSYENCFYRYIPGFEYHLTDLSIFTNDQIKNGTFTRATLEIGLLIQKNIFNEKRLFSHLNDILSLPYVDLMVIIMLFFHLCCFHSCNKLPNIGKSVLMH